MNSNMEKLKDKWNWHKSQERNILIKQLVKLGMKRNKMEERNMIELKGIYKNKTKEKWNLVNFLK